MRKIKRLYRLIDSSIGAFHNGKIKIKKGTKLSFQPYIEKSLKDVIISRLDCIAPKNDVIIESSNCITDINTSLTTQYRCASFLSKIESASTNTILYITNKKHYDNIFYQIDNNINPLSILMNTSTLEPIYSNISHVWKNINKGDNTTLTNVMFIPDVYVFLDIKTKQLLSQPFFINLLVVSVPVLENMNDGIEKMSIEDGIKYVINNSIESAIKCGAKNLIINPYSYKLLTKNANYTANLWYDVTSQQNVIEGIDRIDFTIPTDDQYYLFYNNSPNSK